MTTDLLCLAVGLAIGFGTGWFSYRGRQINKKNLAETESLALKKTINSLEIELARVSERNRFLEENLQSIQGELGQERQFNISLHAELSRERTSRNHLEQRLEQQKTELLQIQQRLTQEFRHLVQQVLEEKSQTLTDINKSNLNLLLQPITDKLSDFKQKFEEQHYRETRELIVLNSKLSNIEAGRWNHQNGSQSPAHPPSTPAPEATASDSDDTRYSLEEEEAADAEAHHQEEAFPMEESQADALLADSNGAVDEDGFQAFTSKQQDEIDNFFKRTLGRAQRKKSPDETET